MALVHEVLYLFSSWNTEVKTLCSKGRQEEEKGSGGTYCSKRSRTWGKTKQRTATYPTGMFKTNLWIMSWESIINKEIWVTVCHVLFECEICITIVYMGKSVKYTCL